MQWQLKVGASRVPRYVEVASHDAGKGAHELRALPTAVCGRPESGRENGRVAMEARLSTALAWHRYIGSGHLCHSDVLLWNDARGTLFGFLNRDLVAQLCATHGRRCRSVECNCMHRHCRVHRDIRRGSGARERRGDTRASGRRRAVLPRQQSEQGVLLQDRGATHRIQLLWGCCGFRHQSAHGCRDHSGPLRARLADGLRRACGGVA
mmetsp:Transcript_131340/g.420376  ORF Transcript_131340/g.420376 Transcript_131340/m.420376 type:complete len:208 (-) Transcript_131340:323-946(-)